jgi:WD40 repeat protein
MAFRKSLKRHTSKFRHVFGTQEKKDNCYEGLNLKPSAWDSCNNIKCSRSYMAVPYAGGGGALAILPYGETGKLDGTKVRSVTGHKSAVLDWDWSPFNDSILASGSEDTTVKVFKIPEGGLTENMSESVASFSGHSRKVGTINWSSTAENILATTSIEKTLKIWDVEAESEACQIDDMGDFVTSLSWNYDGSSVAYVCKDKTLRVGDPRSGKTES